jgi:hypothetical protein
VSQSQTQRLTKGEPHGEGTDAKQQGSQEAEGGQAQGLGVGLQEVARPERPAAAGPRKEILSGD